ncbi:molybdopterin-guanine dinucleotide biosynthesis protein B [Thioalkalivibrio thiocyanodenitrificans]|uniref:molybdopterin-guanine dinucleotide biosynthesis protein B n=1 Tax=Thioalkalivibrio thiocyanodenitrificans TaxID=243063 RepID=UPI000382DD28|nr:molybdopterin-guanine dinucleotide biosynthesis protein B [Thioalkalivibrio thiocyanodenitrificans]
MNTDHVDTLSFMLPVLGFAAWSGTGKTTLLTQLIPRLRERGLRIAMVKHAHHAFDVDKPGKDSYELRKAGASQMLIASSRRMALMTELNPPAEPGLPELLARLDASRADLVLVEGFKEARIPKIELHRPSLGKPLLFPDDPDIVAVASDAPPGRPCDRVLLDLNDLGTITEFVLQWQRNHR